MRDMKHTEHFFDFAARVGLTKHLGGQDATEELAKRCHITRNSYVLDVGCGAGTTPCYLAKEFGCRVVGVDIHPEMVQRSRERAKREKLTSLLEFKTADAQDLPFPDKTFDAVITESVTAFPEDKTLAVREYARVTKPGGYIGLNESTWLKTPVPPEVEAWASQDLGAFVKPLTPEGWERLLVEAGLKEIYVFISPISAKDETRGLVDRYGWGGMLGNMWRALKLYLSNPNYREFVKSVREADIIPPNLEEYFGYGLFIGRK
jgi:ubiquinone/menaquinone biosynthesis C-methylase UbiE